MDKLGLALECLEVKDIGLPGIREKALLLVQEYVELPLAVWQEKLGSFLDEVLVARRVACGKREQGVVTIWWALFLLGALYLIARECWPSCEAALAAWRALGY